MYVAPPIFKEVISEGNDVILFRDLGGRNRHHQPRQESKKSPRSRPLGAIIDALGGQKYVRTSVQAVESLFPQTKVKRWSIAVVQHTCRVIYISSPSQNLKNLEICPDRDPRAP